MKNYTKEENLLAEIQRLKCLSSRSRKTKESDKVTIITELRQKYKLTVLLEMAGMPRSTYYYYLKKQKSPDKYALVKDEITSIYHENQGRYGYRRITLELHNRGYCINHKTVRRLMADLKLKCMVRVKRYPLYKSTIGENAPNFIKRNFNTDIPYHKLTTDIAAFSLFGTKLYLSPILNIYNSEIVSYSISKTPNHKTVHRLMTDLKLKCMVRIKRYNSYKGTIGEIAPNLIERNFNADAPYQKWTTDITEFSLFGTKLYLSPILDMYNSEIISYSISKAPILKQVLDMIDEAFKKLPDNSSLILHSDQGWQYQHKEYQQRLKDKGIRQSMSRKGNCFDNSIMENFFGLLKSELLYLREFSSMEEFKVELEKYIDYYNNKRIKSKLKGLAPVQYRIQSTLIA